MNNELTGSKYPLMTTKKLQKGLFTIITSTGETLSPKIVKKTKLYTIRSLMFTTYTDLTVIKAIICSSVL